jgi:nitrate reductase delta subunit
MSRMISARRPTQLEGARLTVAWQAASLLLGYPDGELCDRLDLIRDASRALPAHVGGRLRACVARLGEVPLGELEADYVETFDSRRRHSLFLTYFAYGDTRKRGMALLRFKQTYQASGFELTATELPDHLCVVLEYAATIDRERGRRLMLDHRAGLELLRISLVEAGSRWAGAVEAVTATLPPLRGDERDAVRRLAAEGPPEEEVGLTPYATPLLDPGAAHSDGPVLLPMPSFPGAR